jgi:hypothetical protein
VPETPPIIAAEEASMAPVEPFEAAPAPPKPRAKRKRPPRKKNREADSAGEGPPTGGG